MNTDLLIRIATHANARIDELFDSGQVRSIPQLTVGMVRMVLDVAQELEAAAASPFPQADDAGDAQATASNGLR